MDRPGEMLLLPVEAELPPNAVVRVNRSANLVGDVLFVATPRPAYHAERLRVASKLSCW